MYINFSGYFPNFSTLAFRLLMFSCIAFKFSLKVSSSFKIKKRLMVIILSLPALYLLIGFSKLQFDYQSKNVFYLLD